MKTCVDCNITLPLTDFVIKASCKDGHEPRCKRCRTIRYNKSTPALLCKKIYNTQISNSVLRNHPLPTYTLSELTAWVTTQPNFADMYLAWQEAKYPKDLAPSTDRMDDNKPYSLDNLQLLTWTANRAKAGKSKQDNVLLVNHRAVNSYTKDGVLHKSYLSMAEAMREFGGNATMSFGISSVCNGKQVKDGRGQLYMPKTYKGFIWKWAKEELVDGMP